MIGSLGPVNHFERLAGDRRHSPLARCLADEPIETQTGHPVRTERIDMPQFMDFHENLKLPADAIAQIADDTRHERADEFGVRQIELYHNPEGQVYCLLEGPDEDAIRRHHAALGVECGAVHRVDGIT
ncbi:MAG: nickel-binding protein [Streptosporangiaceae bacterium]